MGKKNDDSNWLPKEFTERTVTKAILSNIKRKRFRIDDVVKVEGIPLFSWVELNFNELCNRTCVFCPRSDSYPNTNVHMDIELAELIASQLDALGFTGTVNISGTGEALLTKNLIGLVKVFGDRNILVEIVTNGDKLNPKLIKDLYASGLTQLVISMYDGPEQKKYFNDLFKKSKISKELYTLRDRWYDKGEDYGLIYTNRAGSLGENLPAPEERACYYPHYALYIDWNGDILLCCQDMYNRTVTFGNVKDRPLFEIWKDQRLTEFRKKLKVGDRSESPCKNCNANGKVFGKNHADIW
jgi:radical SAM protein with 4Fe4S-binding SPASM domain